MFSRSSAFFRSHVGKRMWRTAQQQTQQQSQKRAMGGGGAYMETNEFGERMGEVFGTIAWLWVFWRFKQDGKVLLGMEHPWDHGHSGHDDVYGQQLRVQGLMSKFSVKAQTKEEMIANWDAFNEKSINPGEDDDDDDEDDDDDDDDDEDEEEDDEEDDDEDDDE